MNNKKLPVESVVITFQELVALVNNSRTYDENGNLKPNNNVHVFYF